LKAAHKILKKREAEIQELEAKLKESNAYVCPECCCSKCGESHGICSCK
jgi:transcription initiation factor IIE alpha subunit